MEAETVVARLVAKVEVSLVEAMEAAAEATAAAKVAGTVDVRFGAETVVGVVVARRTRQLCLLRRGQRLGNGHPLVECPVAAQPADPCTKADGREAATLVVVVVVTAEAREEVRV